MKVGVIMTDVNDSREKTRRLLERAKKLFSSASSFPDLVVSEGKGLILKDVDGKSYLDFAQQTVGIGHRTPEVVEAIERQIKKLIHITGSAALTESFIDFAEKIRTLLPGRLRQGKILFCTTGTEACDYSVGLARFYTKRGIVCSYQDSFHGLTGTTLGLTGECHFRRHNVPLITETCYLPYPYCYRCSFGLCYPDCELRCLDYVEIMFETVAPPDNVAAIIVEPMQIHGGVVVPPNDYLPKLKDLCEKYNVLLLDDEVYTGIGKSGKFLAIEHWNVEPDIICLGKALGGGLPMAAVASRKEIIDSWNLCSVGGGRLGSFGGHTMVCEAASAHIETMVKNKMIENASKVGEHLLKSIRDIAVKQEKIGDVRGKGLLIGIEMIKDKKKKTPAIDEAKQVVKRALEMGLLIVRVGRYGQTLKLCPPLCVTIEEADKAVGILDEILTSTV